MKIPLVTSVYETSECSGQVLDGVQSQCNFHVEKHLSRWKRPGLLLAIMNAFYAHTLQRWSLAQALPRSQTFVPAYVWTCSSIAFAFHGMTHTRSTAGGHWRAIEFPVAAHNFEIGKRGTCSLPVCASGVVNLTQKLCKKCELFESSQTWRKKVTENQCLQGESVFFFTVVKLHKLQLVVST